MSETDKLVGVPGAGSPGDSGASPENAAEPKAESPEVNTGLPEGKAERAFYKHEPEPNPEAGRKGYMKSEHEESEAAKASLPKGKDGKPIEKKGIEFNVGPVLKLNTKKEWAHDGTKENNNDKEYEQTLRVKTSDIELLSASINPSEGKGKVTVIKAEVEADVWHGQVDLGAALNKLFGVTVAAAMPAPPSEGFAPMAARVGDLTTHGSPLVPGTGSPNVFIGGMPAWRVGLDIHACTTPGGPPHGAGPTAVGSPTVFINGAPAARMGDWVTESVGGPNVIVTGCATVFIGIAASPPPASAGSPKKPDSEPFIVFEGIGEADLGHVEAKVNLFGEWDLKAHKRVAKAEGDAEASVAKIKVPLNVKIKIPFDGFVSFGVNIDFSFLTIGAGAGLKLDGNKWQGGSKLGAGIAGVGVKGGFDVGPNESPEKPE